MRIKGVADCLEALIGCMHESQGSAGALELLQHIDILKQPPEMSPQPAASPTAAGPVQPWVSRRNTP